MQTLIKRPIRRRVLSSGRPGVVSEAFRKAHVQLVWGDDPNNGSLFGSGAKVKLGFGGCHPGLCYFAPKIGPGRVTMHGNDDRIDVLHLHAQGREYWPIVEYVELSGPIDGVGHDHSRPTGIPPRQFRKFNTGLWKMCRFGRDHQRGFTTLFLASQR